MVRFALDTGWLSGAGVTEAQCLGGARLWSRQGLFKPLGWVSFRGAHWPFVRRQDSGRWIPSVGGKGGISDQRHGDGMAGSGNGDP